VTTQCTGQGGTGVKYTYAQLEGLWIKNGGPKAEAPVAAAIALAESGGCTAAQNPTDNNGTQTSWGLWQISNGTHAMPVPNIYDPSVNAQQAVAKYKDAGNAFSPWGTYSSGAYRQYLNGSTTPDTNVPGSPATLDSSTGGAGNGQGCIIGGNSIDLKVTSVNFPCLLTAKGVRLIVGGLCLTAAGVLGLAAAVILAASAFQHPRAVQAVSQVAPVRKVVSAVTP
jgi:hypothetical protein